MNPDVIKAALIIAAIGAAAYLVIHYHVTAATLKAQLTGIEGKLGLVHSVAAAPVTVALLPAVPAAQAAATPPSPVPPTPAPPIEPVPEPLPTPKPVPAPAPPPTTNPIETIVQPNAATAAILDARAAQPSGPAFDPAHPDPAAFFAASGRWMQVNGGNSISGPIGPGHYTTSVGEGEQISGQLVVDGVTVGVPAKAFTVAAATTASLSVTGQGTIAITRLAVVVPTGAPLAVDVLKHA